MRDHPCETLTEPAAYPSERAPGCPFDPPPDYRRLQAESPITRVRLWDGSTPWLVTKYADQRALLSDQRLSADTRHPDFPHPSESAKVHRSGSDGITFVLMDDPEHARMRRMVTAPFTVRRIEALRSPIQRMVDELIDEMLTGPKPVDLVQAFALPLPSLVICELLGVPYADHRFFQDNTTTMVNSQSTVEEVMGAQANLFAYLHDLVGRKLTEPDDRLLSQLATERLATGELTREDLARMGMLLLMAGHETTTNMIGLGVAALLEHPEQLAELRDTDDPELLAKAVDELLRWLTILHWGRRRLALADIEIGGQVIKAGEGVIIGIDIGNRDPEMFTDPDRLDLHRDAHRHLAFGFGIHQCLGGPLARVELQVAYSTLYRRIPSLRLATDITEVPFKHESFMYGVRELLVTW
jgi:cytochrome P450